MTPSTESPGAPPVEPDTKSWTWVLERVCPECGLQTSTVDRAELAILMRDNAVSWTAALRAPWASRRPDPGTWSVTEYACHVRDVHRLFAERLTLMLTEDQPHFATWDQDQTAVAERYDRQDPADVTPQLVAAADDVARVYESVPPDAWDRTGVRSDGSVFTVESLGRYHVHDVVHHLWDVRVAVTVGGYDRDATAYAAENAAMPDSVRQAVDELASSLGPGARVLEVGSGSGRDAAALEERGLSVRCTDVVPAFVERLRAVGFAADVIDPLTDDLSDPERPGQPYDGVWASACLLHVPRPDLPTVLRRLADATRADGLLRLTLKEGDGEAWSTHGVVATPRRFVYWREPELREALQSAGWKVERVSRHDGARDERWLDVTARREGDR